MLAWSAGLPAEDPVQLAPGPPEQLFGFLDLLGRARVGDLHDPAAEPGRLGEQARLGGGIVQIAHAGTPEQVQAAEQLLQRTRRELYRILAGEAGGPGQHEQEI